MVASAPFFSVLTVMPLALSYCGETIHSSGSFTDALYSCLAGSKPLTAVPSTRMPVSCALCVAAVM